MESKQIDLGEYVKKQTFFTAVVLSVLIGFVGGTVYTSFKLADNPSQMSGMNTPSAPAQPGENDRAAAFAAQIMQMEQFLKNNPEDAGAWARLGNLFFDSNQPGNAIKAYEKSLSLEPGKLGVLTDLGVMYRRDGQSEKAVEIFDKVIALDPEFEQARFNKGIVLIHDLKDFDGGIKAWEELVEINPLAVASSGEPVESLINRMKTIRENQ